MTDDQGLLCAAARLAVRGHGGAEPNPMVGCIIVDVEGRRVGAGYHRRCGGPHAEIVALRQAGDRAAGATAYVTLEPCNHHGRTGPCSEALVRAGIRRVVIGRADPSVGAGGAAHLRKAGVSVDVIESCRDAIAVSEPFMHRLRHDRPWVIAKWAQTVDGRIATRTGASRWISGPASRALVHRQRGRVDAVLAGIGTVLADDPRLTARCRRPRRVPRRVVVDPALELPLDAALLRDLDTAPLTVACDATRATTPRAAELAARGVEIIGFPGPDLPLANLMEMLNLRHDTATVLVEAGAGLLGRLFRERLVNEAWVFTAPLLLGDDQAIPCVRGLEAPALTDGVAMETIGVHRRGEDVLVRYWIRH